MKRKTKMKSKSELSQMKQKFRQTKDWKEFRKQMIQEQKLDPVTLSKLPKTCECHHRLLITEVEDFDLYKLLDTEHQVCLLSTVHSMIHFLYKYYVKDKQVIDRLRNELELMVNLNEKEELV